MDKEKEDLLVIILSDVKGQNEARKARGKRPKFKLTKQHQSILIEKAVELYDRDKKNEREIAKLLNISLPTIQNYVRGWKFKNVSSQEMDKYKISHDKILELEKGLTSESRIKILSELASNSALDAPTRISAIKALNELTSLTGTTSRFLLEIGVNKKSMASYLSMLGIPKESIVHLLAITDAEEIARKMEQLRSNHISVITTECFKEKVEKREIKDQEQNDQEEVNEENIVDINKGNDVVNVKDIKDVKDTVSVCVSDIGDFKEEDLFRGEK